jgi:predicted nucleic acid binding AN1-type Zn finger protein
MHYNMSRDYILKIFSGRPFKTYEKNSTYIVNVNFSTIVAFQGMIFKY